MPNKMYLAIYFYEDVADASRYDTVHTYQQKIALYKTKRRGYKVATKECAILAHLLGKSIQPIPRKRLTVDYRYITVEKSESWYEQSSRFIVEINQDEVDWIVDNIRLEQFAYLQIILARDGKWWKFPAWTYRKTGNMVKKISRSIEVFTGKEHINEYEVPEEERYFNEEFTEYENVKIPIPTKARTDYNEKLEVVTTNGINPAGYPVRIVGNGMALEWKQGYEDKPACWWIRDEIPVRNKHESKTYKNYSTLKSTYCARWSKNFSAWYYYGGDEPPQSWLRLIGYSTEKKELHPQSTVLPEQEKGDPEISHFNARLKQLIKEQVPFDDAAKLATNDTLALREEKPVQLEEMIAGSPMPSKTMEVAENMLEKARTFISKQEEKRYEMNKNLRASRENDNNAAMMPQESITPLPPQLIEVSEDEEIF